MLPSRPYFKRTSCHDSRDYVGEALRDAGVIPFEAPQPALNSHLAVDEPPPAEPDDYGTTDAMPGGAANRFHVEMLKEIALPDDPVELIQGLLPMGPALGVVFGPPKSLKSFLLKHVGLHIANLRPYCGRTVQGGAVAYVTSEGIRGVKRRLIAARRAMGIEGRNVPFALVSTMPNLGAGEGDRAALQQAISDTFAEKNITVPLRLIVIDTLRRSMPGKSENEQKDVSIVLDNCEASARAFGCLVILVHHSPRSNDERGLARMLWMPRRISCGPSFGRTKIDAARPQPLSATKTARKATLGRLNFAPPN